MDKCDEDKDKADEVNSEVIVSEEGIGKIFNACTPYSVYIAYSVKLMYLLSL